MTLRFSTSRAIGLAVALTLGSVATAAAQQTRVPVRKDPGTPPNSTSPGMPVTKEAPPAPSTTPAPTPTPPDTTTTSTTTTTVTTPIPADTAVSTTTTTSTVTTTTSTGEVPATPRMRWGNGFYVGLDGGTQFPQNEIKNAYDPGYNVGAMLGWDSMHSPLGLRLNASWNRLNGKTLSSQSIGGINFTGQVPNADLYSAFGDAKLRLPIFGRSNLLGGLYAVGGAGMTYFRNFDRFQTVTGTTANQSRTGTFNPEDKTRFAMNFGGGLSWGIGSAALFVESRWVRVFTQNRNTDYVPLTVGLTFH